MRARWYAVLVAPNSLKTSSSARLILQHSDVAGSVNKAGELFVRNLTAVKRPLVPFSRIHHLILPRTEVSLVFMGATQAQKLNQSLRKKSYTPNVLSYTTGKESGEVIICLAVAKKQAREYAVSYTAWVTLLFIHALLHLKGVRHSATMEKQERAYLARFVRVPLFEHETNSHRHRHRHAPNKSGGRGGTPRT